MNKKISTNIAIIIIAVFALFVGGIIFVSSCLQNYTTPENIVVSISQKSNLQKSNTVGNKESTQAPKRFSGSGCYQKGQTGEGYFDSLSKDFNLDNADSKIKYENVEKGISFDVPYNTKWGNKDCKVEPYAELKQPGGDVLLGFGKPGGPWTGDEFTLAIFHQRSAEDIINQQKNIVGGEPNSNPRKRTIGDKQVVVYEGYGMVTVRSYEVIGEEYNYLFGYRYGQSGQPSQDKNKKLEKIIANAKFF